MVHYRVNENIDHSFVKEVKDEKGTTTPLPRMSMVGRNSNLPIQLIHGAIHASDVRLIRHVHPVAHGYPDRVDTGGFQITNLFFGYPGE